MRIKTRVIQFVTISYETLGEFHRSDKIDSYKKKKLINNGYITRYAMNLRYYYIEFISFN